MATEGGARQDALSSPLLKQSREVDKADSLTVSSTGSSASAAFARSLFLFLGLMFRRPSKLFRPSRVDTWAGVRQLAMQYDQTLSTSFIRSLLRRKAGMIALTVTLIPPLLINTSLGFLLFTSHSVFALGLARLHFFQKPHQRQIGFTDQPNRDAALLKTGALRENSSETGSGTLGDEVEEEHITLEKLLTGPTIIPRHPTLLSGLAGAGAGLVQGFAFTPIENLVRLLQESTSSLTVQLARFLNLPPPKNIIIPSQNIPSSPVQALRNFVSSETWRKSPSWWTGWRWTVGRDALSYGVFFAAFDVTRRVGLRVKALFGGAVDEHWNTFISVQLPPASPSPSTTSSTNQTYPGDGTAGTPTRARVAQAITIVTGGITASILAEATGRPFRTCQKLMVEARLSTQSKPIPNPIWELMKTRGIRPFFRSDYHAASSTAGLGARDRMVNVAKRLGWRVAAVGPWGFGFLVWAWVGGEV